MKMLKKLVMTAVVLTAAAGLSLAAYAAETKTEIEKKTAYTYTYEEKQVVVGQSFDEAAKTFGKAKEEKTLNNCAAGDGTVKDKVYIYDNFDLHMSADKKGKEILWEIVLKTDKTKTEEGLKLGASPEEVKKLYPDAVENYGIYTATLGNTQLIIDCGFKNDKVVAISYQYYEPKK